MSVALTTLRSTVATALTNDGVWSVFSYPPSNIVANSVIVVPGDPYVTPNNNYYNTIAPMASLKILMVIAMFDNQGVLAGIEDYIVAVFNKLSTSGIDYNVTAVSAPSILSVASGDLLQAELTINILTTWS
jgi:hypothetical protein